VKETEDIRKMEEEAEHRQQEAESLVEAARERMAMTDEQLLREALEALKPLGQRGDSFRATNLAGGWISLISLNAARRIIPKLEERLLRE
jgi:hypothetical protein